MKINKIFNLILFLCLGVILILMLLVYNLNKRITSIEIGFLSFKEKGKVTENRFNTDNYKYTKKENLQTDDNLEEFQKLIIDYVKKNINKIVLEKPVLGGQWIATDIKFLSPDIIKVDYEDGHIGGAIFLKIESAFDSKIVMKPFW